MTIFNEYLTGEEREQAIVEATFQNEYDKLCTLFEMCTLKEEQMMKDAELKVFAESGTYDDLEYLYSEAQAEVQGEKKNILQKIIGVIINLLNSMKNGIANFFKKGDPNQEVEVSKDAVENVKLIDGIKNNIQSGINKIQNKDVLGGAADILKGIAIPAAGTAAVAGAAVVMVKMKKGELDGLTKKVDDARSTVTGWMDKLKTTLGITSDTAHGKVILDCIKKFTDFLNGIWKTFSTAANTVKDAAVNAGNAVKGAANSAIDKVKDAVGKGDGKKEAVPPIKKGKTTFHVFSDGSVTGEDKNGNPITIDMRALPEKVKQAIDSVKNSQVNESVSLEELQGILGDEYTVEAAEDGFYISEMEHELSVSQSLFGIDMSDELDAMESAEENDIIAELTGLFDSL